MLKKLIQFITQLSMADKIFIIILLAGAFLRLYNLENSQQFLGDQGRDALIVSKIFKEKDLVFIGPVTSVGNMYLGPLYYYFMLPFLFLSYPSPMGPIYAVACLGIMTILLLYLFAKKMFDEKIALIASFFYAFSFTIAAQTRFSWNPNPAPLVSIIMIYLLFKVQKNPKLWLGIFTCIAVLLQLHYLTLLAAGTAGLIWLIYLLQKKINLEHLKYTLIGFLIFLASLTPLFLFDLKHDGLNFKAFKNLLTQGENFSTNTHQPLTTKVFKTLSESEGRAMHILFEYMIGKNRQLNQILAYSFILILLITVVVKQKRAKNNQLTPTTIIAIFLFIGILGTAFYQNSIFDHYIAYLFPVTALVYAIVINSLLNFKLPKIDFIKNLVVLIGFIFLSYLIFQFNLQNPIWQTAGWTIKDIQKTAQAVTDFVPPNESYSLILLSITNDLHGQNYRYFLSTMNHPPIDFELSSQAQNLVVIDELKQNFDPNKSELYEIITFPNKKISEQLIIPDGPIIHLLRR